VDEVPDIRLARARWASTTTRCVLGDGVDNVISFEDTTMAGSARKMCSSWSGTCRDGYDALNRLVVVLAPDRWGRAKYDYDALGNRSKMAVDQPTPGTTTYSYDPDTNRLDSLSSTTERFAPMTFTWDKAGRLASSSDGSTYRYDGHGRRVQKAEPGQTTVYHYDIGGRIIAETSPAGAKLRDYIYLGNKLVVVDGCVTEGATACTERQWYHTDTLGSPLARTAASGAVVARLEYQPWGEQWSASGTEGDRQYNGRVYDPGTGFHDYGARMYGPWIGRFISADSVLGNLSVPASLNRYSYVHNNPYKYVDPSGHVVEVTGPRMAATLKQVRATRTGENMYRQLHESERVFRLVEGKVTYSRADNDEAARRGWRTGTGSGGVTYVDFDKKYLFQGSDSQYVEAPVAEVLAHEMQHLVDYDDGHLDISPVRGHPGVEAKERYAIETENRVRKELGLPGERGIDAPTKTYDKKAP
jgi:RHS repeat-associated protein